MIQSFTDRVTKEEEIRARRKKAARKCKDAMEKWIKLKGGIMKSLINL